MDFEAGGILYLRKDRNVWNGTGTRRYGDVIHTQGFLELLGVANLITEAGLALSPNATLTRTAARG